MLPLREAEQKNRELCTLTIFSCVYVCVWFVHMSVGALGVLEALNPLELELQVDVSHLTCILGTEPRSSGRAESILNH